MEKTPRVFISYSWTSPEHEDWVINLSERLVSNGVDVVIDKWELKEGQDKNDFMEKMVKSPDIDKVLIILDKQYSEKANQRKDGVGTETQIISPKVYANVSQEKFIPIVTERDEEGKAYVPIYLEGRIYIDLSATEIYEQNFESLLRNIFKRPAYTKPKIGTPPSYLFEEIPSTYKTSSILRSFDYQINKNSARINPIIREFFDEFYQNLKDFSVTFPNREYLEIGKLICDNIQLYTPLRNDFISFIEKVITSEIVFDTDIIIKFLERLPLLTRPQDNRGSWSDFEFDNFRFFIHELFLYLIAICLKHEKYLLIKEFTYNGYFIQDKYGLNKDPVKFEAFYNHIESIRPYYNKLYSKEYFSPMADMFIRRIPNNLTLELLVEGDLLCHYIGVINDTRWFPITYIYKKAGYFPTFDRMVSKRHFERAKVLFNVEAPQDLKEKLLKIKENDNSSRFIGYSNSFDNVKPIYIMINPERIGTTR